MSYVGFNKQVTVGEDKLNVKVFAIQDSKDTEHIRVEIISPANKLLYTYSTTMKKDEDSYIVATEKAVKEFIERQFNNTLASAFESWDGVINLG